MNPVNYYRFFLQGFAGFAVDDGRYRCLNIIGVERQHADVGNMILKIKNHLERLKIARRHNAHIPEVQLLPLRLQLYTAYDTVPVALGLISDGV